MKIRLGLVLIIALVFVPRLPAPPTNFNGSDDFSSYNPANWGTETSQNGGAFVFSGGVLNFTDSGATNVASTDAMRPWILNTGSSTADWTVQMDFTVPLASNMVAGQFVAWTIEVSNSADSTDYFSIGLENAYMGYTNPKASAEIVTDNSTPMPVSMNITSSTTATLYLSYIASTETLAAAFDGGSGLTYLYSIAIGSGANDWNMNSGETFQLSVLAENFANAGPSVALGAGDMTGDNFLASPTAVPEPASVALLAGLGVLGLALWRRSLG